jgi:hypothetical protein
MAPARAVTCGIVRIVREYTAVATSRTIGTNSAGRIAVTKPSANDCRS